jgi:hypothetical protein
MPHDQFNVPDYANNLLDKVAGSMVSASHFNPSEPKEYKNIKPFNIDLLVEQLREMIEKIEELKTVRSTLLVNYGKDASTTHLPHIIDEKMNTLEMIITVGEYYSNMEADYNNLINLLSK